jgi:hypothetical protein
LQVAQTPVLTNDKSVNARSSLGGAKQFSGFDNCSRRPECRTRKPNKPSTALPQTSRSVGLKVPINNLTDIEVSWRDAMRQMARGAEKPPLRSRCNTGSSRRSSGCPANSIVSSSGT